MENKVFIKIDADTEHLKLEDGLTIHELGELCVAIANAIGDNSGRMVLKRVSEASAVYELAASTEEAATQFQVVWNRLENSEESELTDKEQKLLRIVNKVIKPEWHIEAQDSNRKRIARLDKSTATVKKLNYTTTRTIYGQLFTFGISIGKNENGIVVKDDYGHRHAISANKELFDSLKEGFSKAYRTVKIAFKVKGKVNMEGKFYSLQLVDYHIPDGTLLESIHGFSTNSPDQFSHIDEPDEAVRQLRNHGG